MPESRKERNPNAISLGNVSVGIDPYTAGTLETDADSVGAGTYPIAAGKIRVDVYNEGDEPITVNGDTVEAGQHWGAKAFNDPVEQKTYYTPAISIVVPAGGFASYSWDGPTP